jgi:hypothetical protein
MGGTWRVGNAATLDIPWATIRTLEASLTLAGSASLPAISTLGSTRGTLTLQDGRAFNFAPLGGVFSIEVGGSLVKAGSGTTTIPAGISLNNLGTVRVAGGLLSIGGPIAQVVGASLNGGNWTVSGSGELSIPAAITNSDSFITLDGPGAVFAAVLGLNSNQGSLSLLGGRQWLLPTFTNSGTISLMGASILTVSGGFNNSGLVSVQSGSFAASGGGQSSGEFAAGSRGPGPTRR